MSTQFQHQGNAITANTIHSLHSVSNFSCITVPNITEKKDISYNLKAPVTSFVGRLQELDSIRCIFQSENEQTSEITSAVVMGLAGTGKTELVRKYAHKHFTYYKSIVWIDSETSDSIKSTFETLAKDELGITENRLIQNIIRKVYEYLSQSKTLFIFDNVEGYAIIQEFLPSVIKGNISNIHVLLTSQTKDWEVMDEVNIHEIILDTLLPEDAKEFVKKTLKQNVHDDDITILIKELAFFPLALTQAVAYINQQDLNTKKMHSHRNYRINDFLMEYHRQAKDILDHDSTIHHRYAKTVYKTLALTFEKISKERNGKDALDVLTTIAYLAPDNIPINTMFASVEDAVHLLHKYAIITIAEGEASAHRLLLQVARLRNKDNEIDGLRKALTVVNRTRNMRYNTMHATFVWKYASKHRTFIRDFYTTFYAHFTYGDRKSTPLHLLVSYDDYDAIKALLTNVRSDQLRKLCNYKDLSGDTPLHMAISENNMRKVKVLVESGFECNVVDGCGNTALIMAVHSKNLKLVKLLVENGSDCNVRDGCGTTALIEAVHSNNVEIVKLLVKSGGDFNVRDGSGKTALMEAVHSNNVEIVKLLLESGGDCNVRDGRGNTALIAAVHSNNVEMVKLLVKSGGDFNVRNGRGRTALIEAVFWKNVEIVKLLLESGGDCNVLDGSGHIALMEAVFSKNLEIIKLLVENGGNPNVKDVRGNTAFIEAVYSNNVEIVKLLLESGGDCNVRDGRGNTALIAAVHSNNVETVKLLVESGGDFNVRDGRGSTALIEEVLSKNVEIVKLLLEIGGDCNVLDGSGHIALMEAVLSKNVKMIKLLVESGGDFYVRDVCVNTAHVEAVLLGNVDYIALMEAVFSKNLEIIKLLVENGGNPNVKDVRGNTAFIEAVYSKNWEAVKLLAEKSVDCFVLDAPFEAYNEYIKLLEENGCDRNGRQWNINLCTRTYRESGHSP